MWSNMLDHPFMIQHVWWTHFAIEFLSMAAWCKSGIFLLPSFILSLLIFEWWFTWLSTGCCSRMEKLVMRCHESLQLLVLNSRSKCCQCASWIFLFGLVAESTKSRTNLELFEKQTFQVWIPVFECFGFKLKYVYIYIYIYYNSII